MDSHSHRFLLSTDECELLLLLEESSSLQLVAEKMGRDHSVISRILKRISEKMPTVEKKAGRWILTEMGKRFNEASRSMIATQTSLSHTQQILRIGTNREFSARVLGPDLGRVLEFFPNTDLTINAYENGVESALLKGQADVGIDCARPNDPEIAHKLITHEPIISVCGKEFFKKHEEFLAKGEYFGLPHLLCDRLHPAHILAQSENNFSIAARFNDIATARSACVQNVGWALLPIYAISSELKCKDLIRIDEATYSNLAYGIWWIRHRVYLQNSVEKLAQWLRSKTLSD